MASLLNCHARFSVEHRAFPSKAVARDAGWRIDNMMMRRFKNWPLNAVKVSGSKDRSFIEFPRIHHIWAPKGVHAVEIAAELEYIANQFDTIYERVDADD